MQITREALIKRIKARDLPVLTLVHTEEGFFIDEILALLRDAYAAQGGWGYEVVDASSVDASGLVTSAGTLSFGGGTKVTVIRSAQKLKKEQMEALERIGPGQAAERVAILLAEKEFRASDNVLGWAKNAKAEICHIPGPKAAELSAWVATEASTKGFAVDSKTLDFMLDLASGNLMALAQMLAKIDIYRGEKTKIGLKDVEDLLADSFEKGVYDCVRAAFSVGGGKVPPVLREKAAKELHRVLRFGVNEGIIEVTRALAREAFALLKFLELHSRGLSRDAIAREMKLGVRKWLLDREYPERAAKWSRERVHNLLIRLADVDLAVRTAGRDAEAMLEQIVIGNLAPTSVEEFDEIFV